MVNLTEQMQRFVGAVRMTGSEAAAMSITGATAVQVEAWRANADFERAEWAAWGDAIADLVKLATPESD